LKVDLPNGVPGGDWNKLEENAMGEFGWKEVLKQFSDEDQAKKVATAWDGDDYATYEQKDNKEKLMLFTRVRFNTQETAFSFFEAYREALRKKYPERNLIADTKNDLEFTTSSGGVFFRCEIKECITLEGGDQSLFLQWTKKLGWRTPGTADSATLVH